MSKKVRKPKEAGGIVTWKLKQNEPQLILDWLNQQDNVMDSLRFLVEQEIVTNGIRNMQLHIPSSRSLEHYNVSEQIPNAYISKPQEGMRKEGKEPIQERGTEEPAREVAAPKDERPEESHSKMTSNKEPKPIETLPQVKKQDTEQPEPVVLTKEKETAKTEEDGPSFDEESWLDF
ncbi:hypothetical protein LCY76_23550 [Fictibacillus sp. KIGAM418]|uniref:Uncharacterized protein n=1 Tax=Fictibacillus marinisediminis TaxID=2878389 RepID=A0A9X1XH43_9BACL|nr:hypothetical protein [Fictibacillus marinisediminis]MCK6259548.1 hypothetical protein [Fictibacillus marinisediminis]